MKHIVNKEREEKKIRKEKQGEKKKAVYELFVSSLKLLFIVTQ